MPRKGKGKPKAETPQKPVAPENFRVVEENRIYRSGMLEMKSASFLKDLELRSVIYLCPDDYDKCMMKFFREEKIKFFQFGIAGKTDPSKDPQGGVAAALKVLTDKKNHPVLIHCRGGKHRTGCLVGSLRKLQGWEIERVTTEYKDCAGLKLRESDMNFLESYDVSGLQGSLGPLIRECSGWLNEVAELVFALILVEYKKFAGRSCREIRLEISY